MNKFWEKVVKCEHKNLSPDYCEYVSCWTPYCGGWEEHCLDCGVFITKCGCGFNNGMSGWPEKRWRKRTRRKYGYNLY
jgi:hypothetical protein